MKSLIVFDSLYGNTQKIAELIAHELKGLALSVDKCQETDLRELDLLIVGSPINGGRPSPKMVSWLESIPKGGLKNIKIAAFDTRMEMWFAKLFGNAAPKIEVILIDLGGTVATTNTGFIVSGKEGPIKDGELERAKTWAASMVIN